MKRRIITIDEEKCNGCGDLPDHGQLKLSDRTVHQSRGRGADGIILGTQLQRGVSDET